MLYYSILTGGGNTTSEIVYSELKTVDVTDEKGLFIQNSSTDWLYNNFDRLSAINSDSNIR